MEAVNLHPAIEDLISKICTEKCVEPPDISARRLLASIAENSAIEVLKKISQSNSTIRNLNGYIIYMVKKNANNNNSANVNANNVNGVLPQKRPGSPLSAPTQKSACYVSPNSKQFVRSSSSPSNNKTIPDYYPCQKQVSFLNPPKTFNPASCVPKRLQFSSVSGADDVHNKTNISQQPIASQNVSYRFPDAAQKQHTLSPCSTSKHTSPTYVADFPYATHNGSQVPQQHTLSLSQSFGGASLGNFDVGCSAMVPYCVDNAIRVNPMTPNQSNIPSSLDPCQKQVSFVNPPKTFNPASCVPKRLTFSSVCGAEDAHNKTTISQQPIASQNVGYRFVNVPQKQHTLSPCSTSKRTSPTYVSDFPFATQNGSPVLQQHTLLSSQSFGGANLGNFDVGCSAMVPYCVDNATRVNPITPNQLDIASSLPNSQQSLNLNELEFRKMFLVYSYVGRRKLEDVVSVQDAIDIKKMKTATMIDFEAKIWAKYGRANCEPSGRANHLDWDSGKTYLYHCYVSIDGSYWFKGPILNTRRTHLQRELGDDNVLIVQFADDLDPDMPFNKQNWSAAYKTISDGISIGVRHYSLFAFKDGRGDNKKPKAVDKKKSRSSWAVKCYFVRTKSHNADWLKDFISYDKTMHEVRCLFMHVHMTTSIAKYISRCSLALSNTIQLRVDLATVDVQRIEDIPCRDDNGEVVCDKDGEALIHTDGTGFISEDLAILCAKHFIEAKGSKDDSYEFVDLLTPEEESLGMEGINDPPLLVQCRIFKDGYAVKGTLLVNKKLQPRTIQVRPSMIKVERDPTLSAPSFSSLEIVSISRKPRKATLSKNLIALLTVGGVPKEYIMKLLDKALQDAQKVSLSMRTAIRLGLNYGQMDDNATSVAMLGSGIPLDEPYLQHRMSILTNEERKGLRSGKIPIEDSFYLIGTADPTGTLESNEVCVILENGHVSGQVLVYRNPGLHFGDIHVLNAKHVPALDEFVGNAKYGIFFSTKGRRSMGSEIANGDFDGDLYWVSHNRTLLNYYKVSKPWEKTYFTPSAPSKKPSELSHDELEKELVTQLFATQKQNMVAGKSADSWLSFADQHIVLGKDDAEKPQVEEKMLKLTDLYYDALDAGKSGKKIEISNCLLPQKYPHFLEKNDNKSYHSPSVLGLIYDTVKGYQPDNASRKEVWKLPCFDVKIPAATKKLWNDRYKSYRCEMSDAMQSGEESKNNSADIVIKKYKTMLYEAEDFSKTTRKIDDIYSEALAIYHASYDMAMSYTIADVKKCGFAWKVAGEALCSFHQMKTPGRSIPFKSSVLSSLF